MLVSGAPLEFNGVSLNTGASKRAPLEFNGVSLNTGASRRGPLEFNGVSLNTAASNRVLARIQWDLAKHRC